MAMHKDQLAVEVDTVRRLVDGQFPQWRALPVHRVSTAGTVNAIFRLGEDLAARFPLRPQEERRVRDWLRAEAAAMREFAAVSRVPAPRPVAIGEPGGGYPLPWSVQTWLPGADAFQQAMGLVWYYAQSNPAMSRFGRRTLQRLARAWP